MTGYTKMKAKYKLSEVKKMIGAVCAKHNAQPSNLTLERGTWVLDDMKTNRAIKVPIERAFNKLQSDLV